jgi:predicted DsbA family dithiol-disulfide isomerase
MGTLKAQIERGEGLEEVEEDFNFGRQVGITGVPFFVLAGKYALTGAQPVSAFLQAFEQASSSKQA